MCLASIEPESQTHDKRKFECPVRFQRLSERDAEHGSDAATIPTMPFITAWWPRTACPAAQCAASPYGEAAYVTGANN